MTTLARIIAAIIVGGIALVLLLGAVGFIRIPASRAAAACPSIPDARPSCLVGVPVRHYRAPAP